MVVGGGGERERGFVFVYIVAIRRRRGGGDPEVERAWWGRRLCGIPQLPVSVSVSVS